MAEVYDQNGQEQPQDPTYYEEEDGSLLSLITNNIVKIIIGLVILVLLIGGVIFFLNTRTNQTATKTATVNKPTPTRTITTPPSQLPGTGSQTQPTQADTTSLKTYTDNTLKYSVSTPPNWEAFKRAGNDISYQTGFRPVGSADVPITINVQPNSSNLSLEEIVAQMYGSAPKELKQVNGKPAYLVQNSGFNSYIFVHNGKIYEISGSTVGSYVDVFNQVVSSFRTL